MAVRSWVVSANDPATDFPLENLPYGVFRHEHSTRIGVAIGDQILDLRACATNGLLRPIASEWVGACTSEVLNQFMALGPAAWSALRRQLTVLLTDPEVLSRVEPLLVPMRDAEMQLPAQIGDYTDFYASIHHATRVGKLFRPDNPLLPNYKYVPIGYHGRASSIVVSGHDILRPSGQTKSPTAAEPVFGPSHSLDYELEVGMFVGPGNPLGQPIPIGQAEQHIFGLCLVNDWSARDIQSWEYQPLGPFLAKNFATTISPWIIPMEALAPYRVPAAARPEGDPVAPCVPQLSATPRARGIDLTLEVFLQSEKMRKSEINRSNSARKSSRSLLELWRNCLPTTRATAAISAQATCWQPAQSPAPEQGSEGCLLEMKHRSGTAQTAHRRNPRVP